MTAPTDFVTLSDAKAWLGTIAAGGDSLLALAIAATTQGIVDALHWDPNQQTVTELYNGNSGYEIAPNGKALQSVGAINFLHDDGTSYAVDITKAYVGDYTIGLRGMRFPKGRKNIQITYTRGYSPIPAAIVLAAKMTLKAIWVAKDVDQHVTGEEFDGVISASFWQTGPGSIPPQAMSYLQPYVLKFKTS